MNGAVCQSCGKLRANLHPRKSLLSPKTTFLLCQTCIDAKFEPRWFIIMWGRTKGWDSVSSLIAPKKKYYGDPISAADLIK